MKRNLECLLLNLGVHANSKRQNSRNAADRSVHGECEGHMRPSLLYFDCGSQGVGYELCGRRWRVGN